MTVCFFVCLLAGLGKYYWLDPPQKKQEGQRCPKRRVPQAAIRLATAVIKFKNKDRNVRIKTDIQTDRITPIF